MLGGISPIVIFEFSKVIDTTVYSTSNGRKIPVAAQKTLTFVPLPPIPIYLDENITGIFIDKEDKNIDIGTDTETFMNGETPDVLQKGVASTVKITMLAKKDSIPLMILSSVLDLIFDKVTSKEYAITYLSGPTTIFRAVLHSFSISQSSENDKMEINIELSRGAKQPTPTVAVPSVAGSSGAIPVGL